MYVLGELCFFQLLHTPESVLKEGECIKTCYTDILIIHAQELKLCFRKTTLSRISARSFHKKLVKICLGIFKKKIVISEVYYLTDIPTLGYLISGVLFGVGSVFSRRHHGWGRGKSFEFCLYQIVALEMTSAHHSTNPFHVMLLPLLFFLLV